jgi:hypothetical protein
LTTAVVPAAVAPNEWKPNEWNGETSRLLAHVSHLDLHEEDAALFLETSFVEGLRKGGNKLQQCARQRGIAVDVLLVEVVFGIHG